MMMDDVCVFDYPGDFVCRESVAMITNIVRDGLRTDCQMITCHVLMQ
ncbi:MAG: hypothetical protein ACI8RD_002801 [Bacillariaceae sp.]|jgi:hypothetical protein